MRKVTLNHPIACVNITCVIFHQGIYIAINVADV